MCRGTCTEKKSFIQPRLKYLTVHLLSEMTLVSVHALLLFIDLHPNTHRTTCFARRLIIKLNIIMTMSGRPLGEISLVITKIFKVNQVIQFSFDI